MLRTTPLACALLLTLPACRDLPDALDEATEIAAEGAVKRLREPARAPVGAPRVLVFALDGVGHDALERALSRGALPALASILGSRRDSTTFDHGVRVGPVLTVLPSITLAAWTTLFTGAPPGETGVPGNEWFDRDDGSFHAPAPVSVKGRADALETLSDQLLDSLVSAPTLFERAGVRSYVSLLPLHRGADLLAIPGVEELADLLAAFPEGALGDEPVKRELYSSVDRASGSRMAELVRTEGPPDLGVVYFPGTDLYTHAARSPLAAQQRYLEEVTDSAIAEVLAAYRTAGALEGTYVIVTADHGHTPVPHDRVHALASDSAFSAQTTLEDAGFRVRPLSLNADSEDHQAVMAWQGAFAYVYLADRSTCPGEDVPCAWSRPPRWGEDVLPAARALSRAAANHPSRPLDLVLLRRPVDPPGTSELLVLQDGEPVGLEAYLSAHPRPELLRFAERLGWLTDGPRAALSGDVILMARLGASLPLSERHYFSHPYYSWHASAEAQDSHAPLLLARTDLSATEIRERLPSGWPGATQRDFLPFVLHLLGDGEDGTAGQPSGGGASDHPLGPPSAAPPTGVAEPRIDAEVGMRDAPTSRHPDRP